MLKKAGKAILMAFGMFTAIPLPLGVWDESCAGLALVFFPAAGLIVGLLWFLLGLLCRVLLLPDAVKAAVLMLFPLLITGFLHLDGFMDTSDALLSRRDREEKRRILKDPHCGAFAVISLAVLFVVWYSSSAALVQKGIPLQSILAFIFIPVVSRAASALSLLLMPALPQSAYGALFGKKGNLARKDILTVILAAACVLMGVFTGPVGIIALTAEIIFFLLAILYSRAQLGGVSGDLAGHALVVAETAAFFALVIL